MQFSTLAVSALFAAAASAYTVLTPTTNSTVTKGNTVSVKWSSVDTDAETFSIYLVNFQTAHWPPTVLSLAQNVAREAGRINIRIPCDVTSDYGWQLNFINGTNTYVIYAQSPKFTLTGDCSEPVPTTSTTAYPTATGFANTTIVSVTATTTVCNAVETIAYETPVVWFVQPSALVVAGAMCPPSSQQTVTVYHPAPVPTTVAGGQGTYGNSSAAVIPQPTSSKATGTGSLSAPSAPASFTGAASSVRVGGAALAVVGGAIAMML